MSQIVRPSVGLEVLNRGRCIGVARGVLNAGVPPGGRINVGPNLHGKVVSAPFRQSKSPIFDGVFAGRRRFRGWKWSI